MTDDASPKSFVLAGFLPYMLNQVAEAVSKAFQERYQKEFGLSRTQWRLMAHLYAEDGLTAKEVGVRIHEDKVSISRAVASLEADGRLARSPGKTDRRFEQLHLTEIGRDLFERLALRAREYEADLQLQLGPETTARLRDLLAEILPLLNRSSAAD